MSWFGAGEEIKDASEGITNVTEGVRHLFTGEIPPNIQVELDKIDKDFTLAFLAAEKGIPWWESSRSIAMLWLVLNTTIMMWISPFLTFDEYWVSMLGGLTGSAVIAFFGSKGAEFWKHGRFK